MEARRRPYRGMNDVRNEADLQLNNVGRLSIERGLVVSAVELLEVALNEELLHDFLGRLNVEWPGLCGIGEIRGVQHGLKQSLGVRHGAARIGLLEEEVGGHTL